MRGTADIIGTEKLSQNGYVYVKTSTGWRLKHHLVAEEGLGRSLSPVERVRFVNGDRTDLRPDNLEVKEKGRSSRSRRNAMRELQIIRTMLRNLEKRLDTVEAQFESEVEQPDEE